MKTFMQNNILSIFKSCCGTMWIFTRALLQCTTVILDDSMPLIENAQEALKDIYGQTAKEPVMRWIYEHAELPISS